MLLKSRTLAGMQGSLSAVRMRACLCVGAQLGKIFFPFSPSLRSPSSSPATRPVRQSNGGRQAFPHLLCTLYSRQATPHSYVHFMHSSECKRLQRGVRAAEERTSKGKGGGSRTEEHRRRGRGYREGASKEQVRGRTGEQHRWMDGPAARLRRGNAMLSRGYI